jgi:hypothetical protein
MVVVILLYCNGVLRLLLGRNDPSLASDGQEGNILDAEDATADQGHFMRVNKESPLSDSLYQTSPVSSYCTLTLGLGGKPF